MEYHLNRLVEPITLVLIVLLAVVLANGVLFFLNPPIPEPISSPKATGQPASRSNIDVGRLAQLHVFGRVVTEDKTVPVATDAPETRLPLTLIGLFNADEPSYSAAIVAQRGKSSQLVHVNDKVVGTNATLASVHADFIMLRRAGVTERLSFPEPDNTIAERVDPEQESDQQSFLDSLDDFDELNLEGLDTETIEELAREDALLKALDTISESGELSEETIAGLGEEERETLSELLDTALADDSDDNANAVTATDSGYRIGSVAEHPILARAGLKSGDVILSVNGRNLNTQTSSSDVVDLLANARAARLEVQRGSRRFFVTASLR